MNKILSFEEFKKLIIPVFNSENAPFDKLYEIYKLAYETAEDTLDSQNLPEQLIDNPLMVNYLLGEVLYSIENLSQEQIGEFFKDESIINTMAGVVADKALSLSNFNYKEKAMVNRYLPPISSLNIYVNLMLNILSKYERNVPDNTLIVDLLIKSLSIMRSILNLLCDGYETQAFAIWRTLHECECTLILLDVYGKTAINSYLKHMRYGLAYRGVYPDKEEEARLIEQVKKEMAEIGLKSKDMKKYIEYGWMNAIEDTKKIENYKLNFRDGLESLAGLHHYANLYMTSSEILHSTPLLIYSNKEYFYYVTLLNVYESFFRIEKLFGSLFFSHVGEKEKAQYLQMRQLYYSQLVNIHKKESNKFKKLK